MDSNFELALQIKKREVLKGNLPKLQKIKALNAINFILAQYKKHKGIS